MEECETAIQAARRRLNNSGIEERRRLYVPHKAMMCAQKRYVAGVGDEKLTHVLLYCMRTFFGMSPLFQRLHILITIEAFRQGGSSMRIMTAFIFAYRPLITCRVGTTLDHVSSRALILVTA